MIDTGKVRLLQENFSGRTDCYGAGRGACVKKPLTEFVFLRHITGRERIGIYLLRKDGKIGALATDFDDNNLYTVIEYCAVCESYGIVAHIERSKSKGYHAWSLFDDPVPAWKARTVAGCILNDCGLLGTVEVFPKQNYLMPGRYGNYINLPMFGQDVVRERTVFLDPEAGYAPYKDQWTFLTSVDRISEALLDKIMKLNDLDNHTSAKIIKGKDKVVAGYQGSGLPCFATMLSEGVDDGMRNEAALRLSVGLYRTGIPKELGLTMLKEWNERNRPPLDEVELEKAVSNGYLGIYGHGCFSERIQQYCDPSCPIFRKYNRDKN